MKPRDAIAAFRAGRFVGPTGPLTPDAIVLTRRSLLLMTPGSVLKLRRPLAIDGTDFTSRTMRLWAAEMALWIGRRASPGLYLADFAIRWNPDGATLEPGVHPKLEPVVGMQRLPDERCVREVLRTSTTPAAVLQPVMQRIAAFHEGAPLHRSHDGYGAPERMAARWHAVVSGLPVAVIEDAARDALIEQTGAWLAELEGTFAHRVQEGRMRHTHGGLRLEHLYVDVALEGSSETVAIIDPWELGDEAHMTDTAEDVGLLAFDLDVHGHGAITDEVLDVYAGFTADRTLKYVTPFFKRLQALRRAHQIYDDAQADSDPSRRAAGEDAAGLCVELAMRYGGLA